MGDPTDDEIMRELEDNKAAMAGLTPVGDKKEGDEQLLKWHQQLVDIYREAGGRFDHQGPDHPELSAFRGSLEEAWQHLARQINK